VSHAGFVAILGRPNVGKSTLLNALLGEKLAITSAKPQTTRNRISGVVNRGACQLVFVDTPGIHDSARLLNVHLNRQALAALEEVDCVLFLVEKGSRENPGDRLIADRLSCLSVPVMLVVNKCDVEGPDSDFSSLGAFYRRFDISAVNGRGLPELMESLAALMPEGAHYYPDDEFTDRPERFIVEEFVREKVFALTGEEIPYSTAVTVDLWEEREGRDLIVIHATIHVERASQKGIIIGKGGAMIKRIGRAAREDIEKLLDAKVFLDLHVGVEHNWTKDERMLKRFGIT